MPLPPELIALGAIVIIGLVLVKVFGDPTSPKPNDGPILDENGLTPAVLASTMAGWSGGVVCSSCGAPVSDPTVATCPYCHGALYQEREGGPTIAAGDGAELVMPKCRACGAPADQPRATCCSHCGGEIGDVAARAAMSGVEYVPMPAPAGPSQLPPVAPDPLAWVRRADADDLDAAVVPWDNESGFLSGRLERVLQDRMPVICPKCGSSNWSTTRIGAATFLHESDCGVAYVYGRGYPASARPEPLALVMPAWMLTVLTGSFISGLGGFALTYGYLLLSHPECSEPSSIIFGFVFWGIGALVIGLLSRRAYKELGVQVGTLFQVGVGLLVFLAFPVLLEGRAHGACANAELLFPEIIGLLATVLYAFGPLMLAPEHRRYRL